MDDALLTSASGPAAQEPARPSLASLRPANPESVSLGPSTLGEILDRTAQMYRARFLVYLGIAAIPTAALLLPGGGAALLLAWSSSRTSANSLAAGVVAGLGIAGVALVALPIFVAATAMATAGVTHAASRAVFGQRTSIRDAYRAAWRLGWRYSGLCLIDAGAVWGLPIAVWTVLVMVSAMLAAATQFAGMGDGALFGFAALLAIAGLVAYGVWMSVRLSLAFPATVVEQAGAWAAVKRSWTLGTGARGRIFVLYLLVTALNWILSLAMMVPLFILIALLPGFNGPRHQDLGRTIALVVVYGAGFVIRAVTRPLYGIALVLFYYDQRVRREGFDIEWMMLRAGLVVPAQPAIEPQPTLNPETGVVAAAAAGAVAASGASVEAVAEPEARSTALGDSV